ncbi:MAG: hypothetical protein PVF08_08570 [Gammaproteobacteria bacterium]|jgi:hypothetical protein
MIRPFHTMLLAPLLLGACQTYMPGWSVNALFNRLPGGEFTLHRDVVIAPGRTRIIFQDGHASHGASEFEPRCELEVERILDTARTIPARSYRIGKVIGMQRYVNRPPGGTMLAASGGPVRLADGSSHGWFMHTYRMQLLDAPPGDALLLVCGGAYNYPFYARYPTLQEMRTALGDYATLTLDQGQNAFSAPDS